MNIGTIAIIGSIIAGFLAAPAAGAAITGDVAAVGAEIAGTSNTSFQQTPRTVSEHVTAEQMTKTVETPFGTVSFDISDDNFSAELETPRYHVSLERSPPRKYRSYTTASIDFSVEQTPSSVVETCTTTDGTRKVVTAEGERHAEFSGSHQQRVQRQCEDARQQLQEHAARIKRIAADLGLVPAAEIVSVDAEKEAAVVRNTGEVAVDLAGWTISDGSGNSYTFTDVRLAPGESVTVYSVGDMEHSECESSGAPDYERCWDRSHVWNNDGETVTLRNAQGEQADTFTYQ